MIASASFNSVKIGRTSATLFGMIVTSLSFGGIPETNDLSGENRHHRPATKLSVSSRGSVGMPAVAVNRFEAAATGTPDYLADSIVPTATGARLSARYQKLEGRISADGLTLQSLGDASAVPHEVFGLKAVAVGRRGSVTHQLPQSGQVWVGDESIRYLRAGVVEEYRTGVDGIRQDFIVDQTIPGDGPLMLQLVLHGAAATERPYGAELLLEKSGRAIAYSRLHVVDAEGSSLAAKIRVFAPDRMIIEVADQGAVYPLRIDPTYSDADWVSTGGFPGADEAVYALAKDGAGNLYLGGAFTAVGDIFANHIAKWDGNQWSSLGQGVNGDVNALLVSGNNLYVGGSFGAAGGTPANNIAVWNGTQWSALGSGVDDAVYALLIDVTTLYVGGAFSNAGGNPAGCFAVWNGASWSAMGEAFTHSFDPPYVNAIEMYGGQLHVGGHFHQSGTVDTVSIARWNGSAWEAVASGVGTVNSSSSISDLAVFSGELVAAGAFNIASGVNATNIAKWNGTTWSALGLGVGLNRSSTVEPAHCMVATANTLYVGGRFNRAGGSSASKIVAWNGSTWSTVGTGFQDDVFALEMVDGVLFAGGDFVSSGSTTAFRIASWDGNAWSGFGQGFDNRVFAIAASGTDVYVGGRFLATPGGPANYIAKWDGSTWSSLGSGLDGRVRALAVMGDTVYAGGDFTHAGGNPADGVARWDGATWSALDTGTDDTVFALAIMGSDLYAGGYFLTAGGVTVNGIARWDGTTWHALDSGVSSSDPFGFGVVRSIAASAPNIYVGGEFDSAGGAAANSIARWDGAAWHALGDGVTGAGESAAVQAITADGNDVYAGGYFEFAGGVPARSIAKWSGGVWSALGAGFGGDYAEVQALVMVNGDLIVGGVFTSVGGVAANSLASWDGGAWSKVGSPLTPLNPNWSSPGVDALAVLGTDLFVAGGFSAAENVVSPYLAIARPGGGFDGPYVVYSAGQASIYLLVSGPGQYDIQRTSSLPTTSWDTIGTVSGGENGVINFVDESAPSSGAYYQALRTGP